MDIKEAQEGITLKILSIGKLEVKEILDYTGWMIDEIMRIHKLRGTTV